jgi:hypothetical protein
VESTYLEPGEMWHSCPSIVHTFKLLYAITVARLFAQYYAPIIQDKEDWNNLTDNT